MSQILAWGEWSNRRYPLEAIEAALDRAETATVHKTSGRGSENRRTVRAKKSSNVVALRGVAPAAARMPPKKSMLANAQAGLEQWRWLESLSANELNTVVQEIAGDPRMKPLADTERAAWLPVLFGFAAFGAVGATNAQEAARTWSKTSARYQDDADFDRDWQSFDPKRPDGITVGTLIYHAEAVGVDLGPWRERARARQDNQHHHEPEEDAGPTISRGSPLSRLPECMDEVQALAHLNDRFFKVIQWGNAPSFGRFDTDGSFYRLKRQDLEVALAGNFVAVLQPKGPPKRVPAAKWWFDNPKKVTFDRVLYDPEYKRAVPDEAHLNLWTGFAKEPKRGCWRRMRRHIWRVICGRDRVVFKYFTQWLAFFVQFPGTNPDVMIVMRSDCEGVGKSSVGMWMLIIFGEHGLEVTNYKMVFGEFNERIEAKSFILFEEPVFPGNHQESSILKAMTTARHITINPKGVRGYSISNTMHGMMTTNGKWAIPAGADARRFLMLDVLEKMDRAYFDALWQEANSGGIEAMLFDLLRVDLSHFNPREVPITDALVEQQDRSADSIAQWITDCVATGEIMRGRPNGGFGADWPAAELRWAYQSWCLNQGIMRSESAVAFGKALGKSKNGMGLTRSASNNPPKWYIPDPVTLQAASDRRSGIRHRP